MPDVQRIQKLLILYMISDVDSRVVFEHAGAASGRQGHRHGRLRGVPIEKALNTAEGVA